MLRFLEHIINCSFLVPQSEIQKVGTETRRPFLTRSVSPKVIFLCGPWVTCCPQDCSWLFPQESSIKDYWEFSLSLLIFQSPDRCITILHCLLFSSFSLCCWSYEPWRCGPEAWQTHFPWFCKMTPPHSGKAVAKIRSGLPQYSMPTFFLHIYHHLSFLLKPQPASDGSILNALSFQSRISKSPDL